VRSSLRRFATACRPAKFNRLIEVLLNHKATGREKDRIVAIRNVGRGRVYDLQTSSKTFIANGYLSHNSQYLNQPEDPEATDFNTELLKTCRFEMNDQGDPGVWFFPENEWVPFSQMNLYVTWDPALDGKSSRSENAVVITFTAPPQEGKKRMRVGVLKEHAKKESPKASLDKFMAYLRAFKGYIHSSGI
jgi:hypothetical protein